MQTKDQVAEKRTKYRYITIKGETYTASEASKRFHVVYRTLVSRLRSGWSDEDAVYGVRRYK